jgi:type II secretory pathway component PulF
MSSQLTYTYKALDTQGTTKRGVLQAEDQSEAYRQLTAAGLKPIKLVARRAGGQGLRRGKVGAKELAHLTYQFAVLMEARIPIADGLRSIAEQESNQRLRETIMDVAAQIEAGYSITEALSQHRALFGGVYIETVRAAEVSGNMVKVEQEHQGGPHLPDLRRGRDGARGGLPHGRDRAQVLRDV